MKVNNLFFRPNELKDDKYFSDDDWKGFRFILLNYPIVALMINRICILRHDEERYDPIKNVITIRTIDLNHNKCTMIYDISHNFCIKYNYIDKSVEFIDLYDQNKMYTIIHNVDVQGSVMSVSTTEGKKSSVIDIIDGRVRNAQIYDSLQSINRHPECMEFSFTSRSKLYLVKRDGIEEWYINGKLHHKVLKHIKVLSLLSSPTYRHININSIARITQIIFYNEDGAEIKVINKIYNKKDVMFIKEIYKDGSTKNLRWDLYKNGYIDKRETYISKENQPFCLVKKFEMVRELREI